MRKLLVSINETIDKKMAAVRTVTLIWYFKRT